MFALSRREFPQLHIFFTIVSIIQMAHAARLLGLPQYGSKIRRDLKGTMNQLIEIEDIAQRIYTMRFGEAKP